MTVSEFATFAIFSCQFKIVSVIATTIIITYGLFFTNVNSLIVCVAQVECINAVTSIAFGTHIRFYQLRISRRVIIRLKIGTIWLSIRGNL